MKERLYSADSPGKLLRVPSLQSFNSTSSAESVASLGELQLSRSPSLQSITVTTRNYAGSNAFELAAGSLGTRSPQSTFRSSKFKLHPDDFIILLLGPTGSGKTSVRKIVVLLTSNPKIRVDQFINKLAAEAEQRRAEDLNSDTQKVNSYRVMHQGLRLVLVDTPGFDDTYRSDNEILRVIADWLTEKYGDGTTIKITGIIYFHRITDKRLTGSTHKNLHMLGRLCGNVALPRMHIVTTMWDQMRDLARAEARETHLKSDLWKSLIDGGATVHRFWNASTSALDIVMSLLGLENGGEELLLQGELVKQQKCLNETEAGKALQTRLQPERLLEEQRQILTKLAQEANLQNNPQLAQSLWEEYDKIDAQLQKTFKEIKEMKIPLSRRFLLWLFARNSSVRAIALG